MYYMLRQSHVLIPCRGALATCRIGTQSCACELCHPGSHGRARLLRPRHLRAKAGMPPMAPMGPVALQFGIRWRRLRLAQTTHGELPASANVGEPAHECVRTIKHRTCMHPRATRTAHGCVAMRERAQGRVMGVWGRCSHHQMQRRCMQQPSADHLAVHFAQPGVVRCGSRLGRRA